jgi:hypothetical protein
VYISIDMDELQFVHKNQNHDIVSALAWLELPDKSVTIESTDREYFLSKMSGLDLRLLYQNTTGLDITGTDHIVVREMLATLVDEKLTATWAHLHELEAQIDAVEDELYAGVPWKYVLGSRRPTKQEVLFGLDCKPLDLIEATEAAVRAPQRRAVRVATPRAAPAESRPTPPRSAVTRMSSVRPAIWAVADEMWEAAGKPTGKTVVLKLRKEMMVRLETEKGIKRTSSSNELGNWMKARIV